MAGFKPELNDDEHKIPAPAAPASPFKGIAVEGAE
jgi:hypothetical protein